jgi:hypothetical protein
LQFKKRQYRTLGEDYGVSDRAGLSCLLKVCDQASYLTSEVLMAPLVKGVIVSTSIFCVCVCEREREREREREKLIIGGDEYGG